MKVSVAIYLIAFLIVAIISPEISSGKYFTVAADGEKNCNVAKFSGVGEDFSLACAIYLCPFDAACGGTKLYKQLSILRQVREQVLKPSRHGNRYVSMLGEHSVELARLVLENPDLAEDVREIVRILIPIARELLSPDKDNESYLLDQDDALRIKIVSLKFEEKASPELRKIIIKTRNDMESFVNKPVVVVLEQLQWDGEIKEQIRKIGETIPDFIPKIPGQTN